MLGSREHCTRCGESCANENGQNSFGLVANVLELTNVEQWTTFIDASCGALHHNCARDDSSDSLTTVTEGALVYAVVALNGGSTPAMGIAVYPVRLLLYNRNSGRDSAPSLGI